MLDEGRALVLVICEKNNNSITLMTEKMFLKLLYSFAQL